MQSLKVDKKCQDKSNSRQIQALNIGKTTGVTINIVTQTKNNEQINKESIKK